MSPHDFEGSSLSESIVSFHMPLHASSASRASASSLSNWSISRYSVRFPWPATPCSCRTEYVTSSA